MTVLRRVNLRGEKPVTPLEVEVLLHCYCCPDPHPKSDVPSVRDILDEWVALEVLWMPPSNGKPSVPRTTDLGEAWVRAICAVPIPRVAYVTADGKVIE